MGENKKGNPFVSFYGRHGISPVHQDIRDLVAHFCRREKLCRTLGLPIIAFSNKRILEIGPGGGYNALAFFNWGACIDFVEPNPKAQQELPKLFAKHGINEKRWRLFPSTVESFRSHMRYEIVIAEGFIPGLYNRDKVISKIKKLVVPGGVVVVTCIDEIGFLFELVKRAIGHRLLWSTKAETFNDKVDLLCRAFSSHLKSLKFASRPVEDWVVDQFLNPALYGIFFNIAECIVEFGEDFEFLGSSPTIFTDYSWYKDIEFDKRRSILKQYASKRHNLLWYKAEETCRSPVANNILAKKIGEFRRLCGIAEENKSEKNMKIITVKLREVIDLMDGLGSEMLCRLQEGARLLEDKNLSIEKISRSKKLSSAFGRGQQYISLARRAIDSKGVPLYGFRAGSNKT